jgi:exopolysaccharide biosynthesis polyprenyl glycosylphosphotransferase
MQTGFHRLFPLRASFAGGGAQLASEEQSRLVSLSAVAGPAPTECAPRAAEPQIDGAVAGLGRASTHASQRARSRRVRRGWLVRRMLLAADVVGLLAAFVATELIWFDHWPSAPVGTWERAVIFVLLLPVWVLAASLYGLYDRDEERATHSTADEVVSVFHLITVGAWGFFATSWLVGLPHPHQRKLTTFWLLAILAVITARWAARTLARRHPSYIQNTLIVGAGQIGQLIGRKLVQHSEYGINLIGFVDANPRELRHDLEGAQLLGEPDDIVDIVKTRDVERVILAFSEDGHGRMLQVISALRAHNVQIDVVPRLFEALSPSAHVHSVEGLPLLSVSPARIPRSSRLIKRSLDILGAAILFVLTAPLMLLIALLVRRGSRGPIFFRQERLGMDMRSFTLLKFRTMHDGTDDAPHREYLKQIASADAEPGTNKLYKLDRSDVITPVGRWLRRTSLDELPQIFNVLRGDMSLVGPRPAIPYELELYAPHHFERFLVPAGLTGLWQVEARAHSTFREALDLDVVYARSWSLGLDLRLLLRTPTVMLRKGETD